MKLLMRPPLGELLVLLRPDNAVLPKPTTSHRLAMLSGLLPSEYVWLQNRTTSHRLVELLTRNAKNVIAQMTQVKSHSLVVLLMPSPTGVIGLKKPRTHDPHVKVPMHWLRRDVAGRISQ
jgi:hypothetical protein